MTKINVGILGATGTVGRELIRRLRDHPWFRVAEVGASVIWCPSSNHFLYNATADPRSLRERGITVGLGTDSPISGGAHMLAELRSARMIIA